MSGGGPSFAWPFASGYDVKPRPAPVADFLAGKRIAVAGVSRSGDQPANAILRRLRDSGLEVVPINPNAQTREGATCYPDLASVPGAVDALMVVTHPRVAPELARQAAARRITRIWFHRSFGEGSVSEEAQQACADLGIRPARRRLPIDVLRAGRSRASLLSLVAGQDGAGAGLVQIKARPPRSASLDRYQGRASGAR